MKLKSLLFFGYVVIFLLIVMVIVVISFTIKSAGRAREFHDRSTTVVIDMEDMSQTLIELRYNDVMYVMTGIDSILEYDKIAENTFSAKLSEATSMVIDSLQMNRIMKIQLLMDRWRANRIEELKRSRKEIEKSKPGEKLKITISVMQQRLTTLDSLRRSIQEVITRGKDIELQRAVTEKKLSVLSIWILFLGNGFAILIGAIIVFYSSRRILRLVGGEPADIAKMANEIADGNLSLAFSGTAKPSTGIRVSMEKMVVKLSENKKQIDHQTAMKTNQLQLSDVMRGNQKLTTLTRNIITFLCKYMHAQTGLFYLAGEDGTFRLMASYAHKRRKNLAIEYKPGEGLIGQAVLEKEEIILTNVPEDYITIESGLGETVPKTIIVKPVVHEDEVKAVLELGALHDFPESDTEFLDSVSESIALAIVSAGSRVKLAKSLEESQALSEELQVQQEELRTANEELEEQAQLLKESEEKLKMQQEELQVTNEELEEKNDLLEVQKQDVEKARAAIEEKARELEISSKYKSEFLANMSHELRTPLNSLLLLAQSLHENKQENLTAEQVESAGIIHKSGVDLLNLINEILDLSKIEAGRMDIHYANIRVQEMADTLSSSFQRLAAKKGVKLQVSIAKGTPQTIRSDRKRVVQILRNLVSNAIKFTEEGEIGVVFRQTQSTTDLAAKGLSADRYLAIAVSDTGIGIPVAHQQLIFEAFQQGDGSTARKYRGTGLGLTISRQLAHLLGGEIFLESEPGKGSVFTLCLPLSGSEFSSGTSEEVKISGPARQSVPAGSIRDDREELKKDDRVILVIEDDTNFAGILYKKCHEKGFKCLIGLTAEEGLELASAHLPMAVILDIRLPGMDGWEALGSLKENLHTRHIPVHIVTVEEDFEKALKKGAIGLVTKPLDGETFNRLFEKLEEVSSGKTRKVLLIEDNEHLRKDTARLITDKLVKVDEAETGKQAIRALKTGKYDCIILDLKLPDMDGKEVLDILEREKIPIPPVIVYTARELTREEEMILREHAKSIVIKDVRSQERLLDEVSLFLHSVVSKMPERKRQIIKNLYDTDFLFKDKKALIVDDDMRTTFAVSRLLSDKGMKTFKAENGEKALRMLDEHPDTNIVLLDIMMPVMDGFETLKRIRSQERFRKLPVIVLTAKAMGEDREKSLNAGANDYMTKPIDQERLISLMRVWLYR